MATRQKRDLGLAKPQGSGAARVLFVGQCCSLRLQIMKLNFMGNQHLVVDFFFFFDLPVLRLRRVIVPENP